MPRQLPPLNALKAFEDAARSESFTRASEELCVTQGAVSHQVKALEATLGIKLFNRERQRLVITDAGREYLNVVRDAFDRIAAGTERVLQRQNAGVLTVSTSPDFAAKWLVYRLGRFAEAHPGIDLRVSATMHHIDFVREEVDVAVRHGDGNWSGLEAVRLCTEQLFPVCSPKLMSGRNRITKPSDLLKTSLLHLDDSKAWTQWFDAAGVADAAETSHGLTLNRASMLIDAAVDGQGVALARTTLAAWDLINGRLVRPFDIGLKLSRTYWIVCPKATSTKPKVTTFRDWLLVEAADDARSLRKIFASKL
jgi:LysR family transcriptional regulator, glycine cleavage system transcriptional activator